ncbi:uncharacterized protein LOC113315728 [Papaver somniferum]|uniref:uncharacterized protein LOC113315728 n=1 Tax=Papaver somniferum TaxID=3469 RepID=UPI000E703ED7|nr:uncharacterized protein LOC113315728 [Papaver somniferum]
MSIFDAIPEVVTLEDNIMLEGVPSAQEVQNVVFSLNADSAPGPGGFSGFFYRFAWEIIGEELIKAIQYSWRKGLIPRGLNSNFLFLLPRVKCARPNQFRPIGLSNFCFKIFTKIMTTRMHGMLEKIVSVQQGAFIKGRCIQEQIVLASEMINELDTKRRGGNIGLKLDITQAYDSLSWEFLFEVMKKFGFSKKCVNWIHQLFKSSKIAVLVNGGPVGFFEVSRGLRQGDPLSPILFLMVEDVLSRRITQMVEERKIIPMVNYRGVQPTHIFFIDDVFLFFNGHKRNIQTVMKLLQDYQLSSGQVINQQKSKLFIGGVTDQRKKLLANELQMNVSILPDKYLGVVLKLGRVKSSTVWGVVEMLQNIFASWVGKMLSFMDRLTLVKSILSSILIYNMSVYKWPSSVVKICERLIRNLLWTVDPYERKCVTLKWEKTCSPMEEGGIGLRRLEVVNKSLLMKMLWKIQTSDAEWERFMRAKFTNLKGEWITGYKKSTVWPGLKWVIDDVQKHTRWVTGNGPQISVWNDTWIKEKPLKDLIAEDEYMQQNENMKVADLIVNGEWLIPQRLLNYIQMEDFPVLSGQEDRRVWDGTMSGNFTIASTAELIREKFNKVNWVKYVWNPVLHTTTSSNIWNIVQGICATDEKMHGKGFNLASKCYICGEDTDSIEHILWKCNSSQLIWKWLGGIFLFCNPKSYEDVMNFARHKSAAVREVWILVASITMMEIWFLRNNKCFEDEQVNLGKFKMRVKQYTKECALRIKNFMWDCNYDYMIFKNFELRNQPIKVQKIVELGFYLSEVNQTLICCDGASRVNPGASGFGFVCRGARGEFVYAESRGLGIATNFIAEIMAIIGAAEWAVENNRFDICIQSNSSATIKAYTSGKLPWIIQARWCRIKKILGRIQFVHSMREINFTADDMAKKGAGLGRGVCQNKKKKDERRVANVIATPYTETSNNVLVGFADAGYLSDPHKGRSQTGYVFTVGNTTISWISTKQTLVATSTNHSEIIALHEAVHECIWLRSIITHIRGTCGLSSTTEEPTCIYEDNASCTEHMKQGYIKGDNAKHISPEFFYNQQQQCLLNIQVSKVKSDENVADLFTKSLPKSTFEKHVRSIGLKRLSELP